jgi:EAL domain-containing protein (putative c-di-GMP-specific phosphodiesterase class I)
VTIDDFGTGYSSFSYLKNFQLDGIKIDKSFVRDMLNSTSDLTIIKAIIAMGKNLGVKLIAEGVENYEQLQLLATFGCDEYQGYYYCRPNTAVVITSFLRI